MIDDYEADLSLATHATPPFNRCYLFNKYFKTMRKSAHSGQSVVVSFQFLRLRRAAHVSLVIFAASESDSSGSSSSIKLSLSSSASASNSSLMSSSSSSLSDCENLLEG
jgi:hypothetical protein